MKVCNKCGKLKPDDEFWRAGSTRKGTCRECMKILRDNKKKEYIHKEALKQINTTFKLSERGYSQGYYEGQIKERKYWEAKIKAKVIEIKNRPVKDEFITATQGKLNTIIDIESLLD